MAAYRASAEAAVPARLVTVEQAADMLAISRRGIYDLFSSGRLESVKVGHRRRVSVAEIDRYVAQLRRESRERRRAASHAAASA